MSNTVTLSSNVMTMLQSISNETGKSVDQIVDEVMKQYCEEAICNRTHYKLNREDTEFFDSVINESTKSRRLLDRIPSWETSSSMDVGGYDSSDNSSCSSSSSYSSSSSDCSSGGSNDSSSY